MKLLLRCRQILQNQKWSWGFWVAVLCLLGITQVHSARKGSGPYDLAEDCPRGALIYVQFQNLPELIKIWNESNLKTEYLHSVNFQQFQKRHLALKLIERYAELNQELGFELDDVTFSESAENKTACAVYDIGRMEMLFIARLSQEKIAATKFFANQDRFEKVELPDGTTYFYLDVEVDRGRQKQKMAFASHQGRFILATSEQILLRTLANINGKGHKDRLSDEPSFQSLTREMKPHFFTTWVDQRKLNQDWYFKHYWIQQNVEDLKAIRAGIFDLEMLDGKWVEHRNFLVSEKESGRTNGIFAQDTQRIMGYIPDEVPYVKVQALKNDESQNGNLVQETLFSKMPTRERKVRQAWGESDFSYFTYSVASDDEYRDYGYLDSSYDETIDDPVDAKLNTSQVVSLQAVRTGTNQTARHHIAQVLQVAEPLLATLVQSPQALPGPLFAEFRRATILTLRNPTRLNQRALEQALSEVAQARLALPVPDSNLKWNHHEETGLQWNELELPMLGRKLVYSLNGQELILSNSLELAQDLLKRSHQPLKVNQSSRLDELTLIRFNQRKTAFDQIVEKLDESHHPNTSTQTLVPSQDFLAGNIGGLLNVTRQVTEIRIQRKSMPGRLLEELEYKF